MKKVLSIAGFDGSGGAGIQADLKTFSAFGCYGMTILTSLAIQNTMGVKRCYKLPNSAILEQLKTIFADIQPDAIKIGMLFNKRVITIIADFLKMYAKDIPIILDPVMVAKSGDLLLKRRAVATLKKKIVPLATIITPNLFEGDVLTGILAINRREMEDVAQRVLNLGSTAVLLKGGHMKGVESPDLYLNRSEEKEWLEAKRINTKNLHGTGCTLSAAITCAVALGFSLKESCQLGKKYISGALLQAQNDKIGKGAGPVAHFYHLQSFLDKI